MAGLKDIVIDAEHPARLVRFWAAALDGYEIRAYDDEEIARLWALGFTPETDPSVMVDGPGPSLCFHTRAVPRGRTNHIHLDVVAFDRSAEVGRLVALGARIRDEHDDHTTLLDPEGNAFCVCDPH